MNQSQPPPFFWWSAVAAINHQFSQRGAGRTCPDKPHHLSVINTCTTCYPSPFYCIHRCVQSSKFPLFKSSFSYCFQFKLLVCDSTYLPSLYNLCNMSSILYWELFIFFGGIRTGIEKNWYRKSLGTGIGKIWYRKKVSEPVSEKFGTGKIWYRKKSLGTGI